MPLTAFDPDVTLASILTGVKTIDRALITSRGSAQLAAAQSVEDIFQARLDAAITANAKPATNAVTEALLREQSLLVSRKSRVAEAASTLSKTLTQIDFLQTHLDHLNSQLTALEAGSITAAEVAADWDNKLRKINIIVFDAGKVMFEDGTVSHKTNLLGSRSRISEDPVTIFAPYSTSSTSLLIEGKYLGTDYTLTDQNGAFAISDIAFRASEGDSGTLTAYAANGFPDTIISTFSIPSVTLVSYNENTERTVFNDGSRNITTFLSRRGMGLLDAWLYDRFENSNDINRAQADLIAAEAALLTKEAAFKANLAQLQSGATFINSFITGLDREIENEIEKIKDERDANLRSVQFEFEVAKFNFSLLAARGNTIIKAMLIAKDTMDRSFADTTKFGDSITGSLVTATA